MNLATAGSSLGINITERCSTHGNNAIQIVKREYYNKCVFIEIKQQIINKQICNLRIKDKKYE